MLRTSYYTYDLLLLKMNKTIAASSKAWKRASFSYYSEQLLLQAMENSSFRFRELMRQRCGNLINFFNYPHVETAKGSSKVPICCSLPHYNDRTKSFNLDCQSWIDDPNKRLHSLCLGNFDWITMYPMPHLYWANIFRSSLCNERSPRKVPIFKDIVSIPSHRVIFEDQKTDEAPIQLALSKNNMICALIFLKFKTPKASRNISGNILKRFLAEYRETRSTSIEHNKLFEIFLTFSFHYPAFIATEFVSFSQMARFIYEIRNSQFIDSTSTIVTLNTKALNFKPAPKRRTPFSLLLKVTGGKDWTTAKKVRKLLVDKEVVPSAKMVRMYHRPYYWDILISFKTNKIYELTKLIEREIHKIKEVEDCNSVAYWGNAQSETGKSTASTIGQSMTAFKAPAIPLLLKKGRSIVVNLPAFPNEKYPAWDLLNIRLQNILISTQWLSGCFEQLYNSWVAWGLQDRKTFEKLKQSFIAWLAMCKEQISVSQTYSVLKNEESFLIDPMARQLSKDILRNIEAEKWDTFQKLLQYEQYFNKMIHALSFQLNERLEDHLLVSNTDPHVRFSQRHGVMDLTYQAIKKLFINYCPKAHSKAYLQWDGIILPYEQKSGDFKIFAEHQILYIPYDFKLHIHEKLLPIAHEAAHFILANMKLGDACHLKIANIWKDICIEARDIFHKSFSNKARHDYMGHIESCFNKLIEEQAYMNVGSSEILADILSAFASGPRYFRSLGILALNPCQEPHASNSHLDHPASWQRILLGISMYTKLNCDPRWMKSLEEGFKELMDRHFNMDISKDPFVRYLTSPGITREMYNNARAVLKSSDQLLDVNAFLIKAIINSDDTITKIAKWINDFLGQEYFFFRPTKKMKASYDIVQESSDIYERCQNIAERIVYNYEIVLNEEPKYIAAAAVMYPAIRPVYPSGRLLHSLAYTNVRHSH